MIKNNGQKKSKEVFNNVWVAGVKANMLFGIGLCKGKQLF
jgi:hypothetical protein